MLVHRQFMLRENKFFFFIDVITIQKVSKKPALALKSGNLQPWPSPKTMPVRISVTNVLKKNINQYYYYRQTQSVVGDDTHFVYYASVDDPYHDVGNDRIDEKQLKSVHVFAVGRQLAVGQQQ